MKRVLLLLILACPAFAQRSLEWESIAVKARLDAPGALHVSEEQTYLFNGDWNGGERTVRLGKEQRFTFDTLSRRDEATGELKPLSYGSLDAVDGYLVNGECFAPGTADRTGHDSSRVVLQRCRSCNTVFYMKTLTVRLPERIAAEIESESRAAGISKSDVVRQRLEGAAPGRPPTPTFFDLASDLIGSVDDERMPRDLSARKKSYLEKRGYGQSRHR